jgi:hypothetical protein
MSRIEFCLEATEAGIAMVSFRCGIKMRFWLSLSLSLSLFGGRGWRVIQKKIIVGNHESYTQNVCISFIRS